MPQCVHGGGAAFLQDYHMQKGCAIASAINIAKIRNTVIFARGLCECEKAKFHSFGGPEPDTIFYYFQGAKFVCLLSPQL